MQGATGFAKGYRLASEFVAGTLVGGLIGYGFDWLFGTLPFGLIILPAPGFRSRHPEHGPRGQQGASGTGEAWFKPAAKSGP